MMPVLVLYSDYKWNITAHVNALTEMLFSYCGYIAETVKCLIYIAGRNALKRKKNLMLTFIGFTGIDFCELSVLFWRWQILNRMEGVLGFKVIWETRIHKNSFILTY